MRYITLIAFAFASTASQAQIATIEKYNLDYKVNGTPTKLTATNSNLYFLADTKTDGREIWSIDNAFSPERITDIQQGDLDGIPHSYSTTNAMGVLGNEIFFIGSPTTNSISLLAYDSQNDITSVISPAMNFVGGYLTHNNLLYMNGISGTVKGLYQYDPSTKAVTLLVQHTDGNFAVSQIPPVVVNNHIYYLSQETVTHITLHAYNISTNTDIIIGGKTSILGSLYSINYLSVVNNTLYFGAQTIDYGTELYKYDGTNPIQRLTDIAPGSESGLKSEINYYKNHLYFFGNANDPNDSKATLMYSYNPSTQQLTKLPNAIGNGTHNTKLVEYSDKLYYYAKAPQNANALCAYNPNTNAGYIIPLKVNDAIGDVLPVSNIVRLNNVLFFGAIYREPGSLYSEYVLAKYTDVGLSITNIGKGIKATLYPNPTSSNTTINLSLDKAQALAIQLTDITGRIVYSKDASKYNSGQHNITLPTQQLATGTYIYKLMDEKGTLLQSGQLVKK